VLIIPSSWGSQRAVLISHQPHSSGRTVGLQGLQSRRYRHSYTTASPKRRRLRTMVAQGLHANRWARDIQGVLGIHEIGQYIQLWHAIEHTTLSDEPDKLHWRCTTSGNYTAQSSYLATFHGSTTSRSGKLIWKCWVPPRVKLFHWLADLDRCWTAERLARCGLPHHAACPLCDQAIESI
jgi:hypothetical protein